MKRNILLLIAEQQALLIFAVVLVAYGLTAFMYFGQDDHGLMFKLANLEKGFSQYGPGAFYRNTPYRYIVVPFVPLYSLFGIKPFGYFAIGIVNYFLAALAVYYLAGVLTKKKEIALISALIFAAGYVGGDTMLRLTNSYQIPHTIVFLCLTAAFYKNYIDKKKLFWYLIALGLYAFTIEAFWIRAHGILPIILGLEILFNFNLVRSLVRMVPFAWIYWASYIKGSPSTYEVTGYFEKFLASPVASLEVPARTLLHLFVSDKWLPQQGFWAVATLILFILAIGYLLFRKGNKILWFGLIFSIATFMVYIFDNPDRALTTTHRYATIPFVGVALLLGSLLTKRYRLLAYLIIAANLIQMNVYSVRNLKMRSVPTRNFYQNLTREIPTLPVGSAIYFDVREEAESRRLMNEFFSVGSAPVMSAVAYYYGIDRYDLYLPENFNELLSLIKIGKANPDKVFTFYFDADRGLVNTTAKVREVLFGDQPRRVVINKTENLEVNSETPLKLEFQATTSLSLDDYISGNQTDNLAQYLSYLNSKKSYYAQAKIQASSQWKYQEVWNIADQNLETTWMGDRFEWHDKSAAEVTVDLGRVQNIGAALIFYSSQGRVPREFAYECSLDSIRWQHLGEYHESPEATGFLVSRFSPADCRFVRLLIHDTALDDSPQIAELEIVGAAYANLDFALAQRIAANPLDFVVDAQSQSLVTNYLARNGVKGQICFQTDKNNPQLPPCQDLSLRLGTSQYSLLTPPGGTRLESFSVVTPPQVTSTVMPIAISTLSFENLKQADYILDYIPEY